MFSYVFYFWKNSFSFKKKEFDICMFSTQCGMNAVDNLVALCCCENKNDFQLLMTPFNREEEAFWGFFLPEHGNKFKK